jgi:nucleotide-binding universal stress UspA family protein
MFKKVLFPTDFSNRSEKVIPYINKLQESGTEEVVVLHVVDERLKEMKEKLFWIGESAKKELEKDFITNMKEKTEDKMKNLRKNLNKDLNVKYVIDYGAPHQVILNVANRESVSAIVMASHGASDIEEMLLGSVTDKVVRKSKQPCLIIK